MPNKGLIENLPEFMVVEVLARVDKNGLHGLPLDALPKGFAGLLYNQVAVYELTSEAVITGSCILVLQALPVGPIVDKYEAADQMLATILKIQKRYLGVFK